MGSLIGARFRVDATRQQSHPEKMSGQVQGEYSRGDAREGGRGEPPPGNIPPVNTGGYVGLLQALSCGMADKDDLSERLDWLLRESGAVREASEELVREAKRLRAQIEKHHAKGQRKKPRLRGN